MAGSKAKTKVSNATRATNDLKTGPQQGVALCGFCAGLMKTHRILALLGGVLASASTSSWCAAQPTLGIPEPGVCLYGSVATTNGRIPYLGTGVVLNLAAGTNSVTLPANWVTVNGQVFYVLRVPLETRSVVGTPAFPATPNTLELTATSTTFTCTATVNGTNARLQSPATVIFSRADRGRSTRLDLVVNLPRETFAQWSQRLFGRAVDPNADPLGKGMTYYQQYIAGTDPFDPNSVFKAVSMKPTQSGGIIIQWSSVVNHAYSVLRATNVTGPFVPLATNLPATAPLNTLTDTNLWGPNQFYRLAVE